MSYDIKGLLNANATPLYEGSTSYVGMLHRDLKIFHAARHPSKLSGLTKFREDMDDETLYADKYIMGTVETFFGIEGRYPEVLDRAFNGDEEALDAAIDVLAESLLSPYVFTIDILDQRFAPILQQYRVGQDALLAVALRKKMDKEFLELKTLNHRIAFGSLFGQDMDDAAKQVLQKQIGDIAQSIFTDAVVQSGWEPPEGFDVHM